MKSITFSETPAFQRTTRPDNHGRVVLVKSEKEKHGHV